MRDWIIVCFFAMLNFKGIKSVRDLPTGAKIVQTCPAANNKTAWELASKGLGCSLFGKISRNKKLYHCLPSSSLNEYVEFCGFTAPMDPGYCPVFHYVNTSGKNSAPSYLNCSTFSSGCPREFYFSRDVYKYPECLDIDISHGCFRADNNCTTDMNSTRLIIFCATLICGLVAYIFKMKRFPRRRKIEKKFDNEGIDALSLMEALKKRDEEEKEGIDALSLMEALKERDEEEKEETTYIEMIGSSVNPLLAEIARQIPEEKIPQLKYLLESNITKYEKVNDVQDAKNSTLDRYGLLDYMDRLYEFDVNIYILMAYLEAIDELELVKKCEEFAKNASCPRIYYSKKRKIKDSTRVSVKLATDIDKINLEDLTNIMKHLQILLSCKPTDIRIKGIAEGCVLLSLDVKNTLLETLRKCDFSSMRKHKVFKISIMNECIFYCRNLDDNFHKKGHFTENLTESIFNWLSCLKRTTLKICEICQRKHSVRQDTLTHIAVNTKRNSEYLNKVPNEESKGETESSSIFRGVKVEHIVCANKNNETDFVSKDQDSLSIFTGVKVEHDVCSRKMNERQPVSEENQDEEICENEASKQTTVDSMNIVLLESCTETMEDSMNLESHKSSLSISRGVKEKHDVYASKMKETQSVSVENQGSLWISRGVKEKHDVYASKMKETQSVSVENQDKEKRKNEASKQTTVDSMNIEPLESCTETMEGSMSQKSHNDKEICKNEASKQMTVDYMIIEPLESSTETKEDLMYPESNDGSVSIFSGVKVDHDVCTCKIQETQFVSKIGQGIVNHRNEDHQRNIIKDSHALKCFIRINDDGLPNDFSVQEQVEILVRRDGDHEMDDRDSVEKCSREDDAKFLETSLKTFGDTEAPLILVTTTATISTEEIGKEFSDRYWLNKFVNYRENALCLVEPDCESMIILEAMRKSKSEPFSDENNSKIVLRFLLDFVKRLLLDSAWMNLSNQFKRDVEMYTFLECFHDIGIRLEFKERKLREHVVLDIAAENHIKKDCKGGLLRAWKSFNKTGELHDILIDGLWKDERSYQKHKKKIVPHIEAFRMLASFEIGSEHCMFRYVPGMNKKQFKANLCEETRGNARILLHSVLRWGVSINTDKEGCPCVYQTNSNKEHTVVALICKKDTQLHVYNEVANEIANSVIYYKETFSDPFIDAKLFQRKSNFFGNKELSLILESELSKINAEELQSYSQLQKKRLISVNRNLGFWEKSKADISGTKENRVDRFRFPKGKMATKIVVNQGYIDMIEWQLQSLLLYNEVKTSSIHKTFLSDQEDILKKTKNVGYKSFDIQVMYMLIRNLGSKNQRLRKGRWDGNSMPSPGEIRVGDDLERIRMIRNSLAVHVSSASNPQTELDETWLILSDICRKLKTFTIKMYMDDLEKLTSKEKEDAIMKINKTKKPHKMMKEAMSSVQEFIMKMLKPETKYDSDLNFQTQSETV